MVREYARALGLAAVLALAIRGLALQAYKIPSGSMLPSLQIGDHVLVDKLRYGVRNPFGGGWLWLYRRPSAGDVVVFASAKERGKDYVKRVIAVEGEVVEVREKRVLVDGVPRDVPAAYFAEDARAAAAGGPRDNFGPARVPPGQLFVLGDNRDQSFDSRFWGFVDVDDVQGKAFMIYWSLDGDDAWVRWERIGTVVR